MSDSRPLVNRRQAAVLREAGYREDEHFVVYSPEWTPDTPDINREQIRQAVAASWRSMERMAESFAAEMAPVLAAMQETLGRLPTVGQVAPEQPPVEPMERALWLRKNRNTGPGPARLDGRRGRRNGGRR
ncbi:hypothetical protein [Micromonospora sp. WMMD737]|uniref:hypothetical protein n=1 Tax=Micromonospora sp. WMMD737 TaxID=3404113 RepID=UPI003B92EDB5